MTDPHQQGLESSSRGAELHRLRATLKNWDAKPSARQAKLLGVLYILAAAFLLGAGLFIMVRAQQNIDRVSAHTTVAGRDLKSVAGETEAVIHGLFFAILGGWGLVRVGLTAFRGAMRRRVEDRIRDLSQ
jgi:hypothetical protein